MNENFKKNQALNCVRLLTRIIPYIFEESEWRGFFWSDSLVNKKDSSPVSSVNRNSIFYLEILISSVLKRSKGKSTCSNFT